MTRRLLALLLALAAVAAQAQTYTGALATGDPTLEDGSHFREYPVQLAAGQRLTATLRSPDFDAFLLVIGPGDLREVDDDGAGGTDAQVAFTVPAAGTYTIRVNTLGAGETGAYTLALDVADPERRPDPRSPQPDRRASDDVTTYAGVLEPTDEMLDDSSYVDRYTIELRPGQTLTATLVSEAFDAYLQIVPPAGERLEDDDSGGGTDSRLAFTSETGGTYEVWANSLFEVATGPYRLTLALTDGPAPSPGRRREGASRYDGRLESGDRTLSTGEYVDTYRIEAQAGQRITVDLASSAFDTYAVVRSPSGEQEENDDCTAGETGRSCVEVIAGESGTWEVWATSYAAAEAGPYALAVDVASGPAASAGERFESGALSQDDEALSSGEYVDEFTFEGTGGPVVVDLRSSAFDPYLIVKTDDQDQAENDDHEGSTSRSLLVVDTQPGRTYRALVTSYRPGETGAYDLSIQTGGDEAPLAAGRRDEAGRLETGDETLRSGEYVDTYTFTGVPGQRISLDLTSDVFDTYLVVEPPAGETVQDDDGGGTTGHSRIELDLTEPGTYTVYVTSYAAEETGPYALAMDFSERFGQAPPGSVAASGAESSPFWQPVVRRVADWTLDEDLGGTLDAMDGRRSSGEYAETVTFDGEAREPIRVEMTSDAVDTYLIVQTPSGETLENDDFEGSQNRSVVEFVMPETGRYRVTATSYRAGETGPYGLRISQADALRPDPPAYDRIVGVFMGISDYAPLGDFPGPGDLPYTAADAHLVYDALVSAGMRPEDGVVLTDADATQTNLRRAIAELAGRTDERTMFVFFYSGHGGQATRATGFQREDPDGLDETLALFDGALSDDDLDALLGPLQASRQLLVFDACFSGGFAKDVITQPGRMGMFSSEEDIVSAVAAKFEAGGYLSRFFADAVAARQADEDGNGAISAIELSQYVYERYRGDVRNTGREILVARDTRPAHQKLVVDRGSVGLYDTLFLFAP